MPVDIKSRIVRSGDVDVRIEGRLLKTARLNDEYYVSAGDPGRLVESLKACSAHADLVTFVQDLDEPAARFDHSMSWDAMAVLPLTTYQHWFDKQIKFKPRNKLRKALKSGVETRLLPFTDELVLGIMSIYNETPLRQGKRNWHFGKDFVTVECEHATFIDRSEFIGAFWGNELIGFAKVTHSKNYSIIMNIVAKVAQRDKAPMNALLAKTIELVTARGIPLLNFGVWGRRGLNDFKVANAFECRAIPRYHVPLTRKGELAMRFGLHRRLKDRLPETWIVNAANLRARWNEWLYCKFAALRAHRIAGAEPSVPGKNEP